MSVTSRSGNTYKSFLDKFKRDKSSRKRFAIAHRRKRR